MCDRAVWGLTFVMVQDAIEELPPLAFLAYRFVPAGVLWRCSPGARCGARPDGGGAGRDGRVPDGRLRLPDARPRGHERIERGLHHRPVRRADAAVRPAALPRARGRGVGAAGVSALGLFLLSGAGGEASLRGDGLVFGCACAFAVHILVTERAVRRHDVGALVAVQLAPAACSASRRPPRRGPRGRAADGVERAARDVAGGERARLPRAELRAAMISSARTALILAAEPAFAGSSAIWLAGRPAVAAGWCGAALILGAIVAVDAIPRLRPPRPLPEG